MGVAIPSCNTSWAAFKTDRFSASAKTTRLGLVFALLIITFINVLSSPNRLDN